MLFVSLSDMPYDRVAWSDDGYEFVHATGYALVEPDGFWRNLYEGDIEPSEDDVVLDERWFDEDIREVFCVRCDSALVGNKW